MDHLDSNRFKDTRPISPFSRIDALRDEVLIDVTEYAKEFGFKYPIAITYSVQRKLKICRNSNSITKNNFEERLKNLLFGLCCTIFFLPRDPDIHEIVFYAGFLNDAVSDSSETQAFKAVCGPDDEGKPALTIMVEEDE